MGKRCEEIVAQLWTRIYTIFCTHIAFQIVHWWTIDDVTCILRTAIQNNHRPGECFVFNHFSTILLRKRKNIVQIVSHDMMLESAVHACYLRPPWTTLKWLWCFRESSALFFPGTVPSNHGRARPMIPHMAENSAQNPCPSLVREEQQQQQSRNGKRRKKHLQK